MSSTQAAGSAPSCPPGTYDNPISETNFSGPATHLTITEILALPEAERDELARRMGVLCWEPFTVQAIGTPADAYAHVGPPPENPEVLVDEEEEEERKQEGGGKEK